jgi:hypothetical protein
VGHKELEILSLWRGVGEATTVEPRHVLPDGLIAAVQAVLRGLGRYAERAYEGGRTSAQEMMTNEMMG